jgi:flavin reductase (DIM6/NTAB) family NADH-FMN oxidoreductase RutF
VIPILRPLEEILLASWLRRDTLENIRQTGEFVINVPPSGMEESVMICARSYPPEIDEFEMAGLKPRPSIRVKPPGIEGCLAWAECVLEEELAREKFVLIIGKVVHLEADDRFWSEVEGLDFERAKPLCSMGGEKGMQFAYPVSSGMGAKYAAILETEMRPIQ